MANKLYPNHVLANEVEDQYNSRLDLMTFCTIDNSLVGPPGMKKKINVYSATDGTEKLAMGEGNTKSIEATYVTKEYEILLAQNRFEYYDEEQMTDPLCVQTGMRHAGVDLYNTVQTDIFAEFNKATNTIPVTAFGFDSFVDAVAGMNVEKLDGMEVFAFVANEDMAALRKALKDDLKYVESFVRTGYIGTVAGVNLYIKKDAVAGTICGGTREAVTLFNKKGIEVEQQREGNTRHNEIFSRKFYLAALTDDTKAFKIVKNA